MNSHIKIISILFFLCSCSQNSIESIEANKLVTPNFTGIDRIINCNLINKSNLLNLELFFSRALTNEYFSKNHNDFFLKFYFPNTDFVNNFVMHIRYNQENNDFNNFIKILSNEGFDEIANCNFNTESLKSLSLLAFDYSISPIQSAEILRCNYNEGYNYGTFRVSIEKLLIQMRSLKIPYSVSYLNNNNNNDESFIWINNFYQLDHFDLIKENWIINNEAEEIKNEFLENAACLDSETFQVVEII